jgi:hypothetical protein
MQGCLLYPKNLVLLEQCNLPCTYPTPKKKELAVIGPHAEVCTFCTVKVGKIVSFHELIFVNDMDVSYSITYDGMEYRQEESMSKVSRVVINL